LIESYGWPVVFYWITALSLLPFTVLWRAAEPTERPPRQQFEWRALRALARPAVGNLALYAFVHGWVIYSANNLLPIYINESLGRTLAEVGDVAVLVSLGSLVGGLLSTLLVQRFTVWQIGRLVAFMAIANLLALALPGVARYANGALIIWGITLATADFMYVTLSMMRADPRLGAGSYAFFMAMSNFFIGIGQATTTRLIDTVSYQAQFVALAVLGLLLFPLLRRLQADEPLQVAPPNPAEA
jgi:predicted MFS family arabinose efflux permease